MDLSCFGHQELSTGNYIFDAAYQAVCEPHLDPMGMSGGIGENILHDPFRQFSGALILFQDNPYACTRFHISSVFAIHVL